MNSIRDSIEIWNAAWQQAIDAGCSTFSDDCRRVADAVIRELGSYRAADVTMEVVKAIVDRLVAEYEASVVADMLQGEIYPELANFMSEASAA